VDKDKHNLRRFLDAQDAVYTAVCTELREGRKRSHWMWFVFPQISGLGRSPTARFFSIASKDEAAAYLTHPVLGPRLRECTALALESGVPPDRLFGSPDDLKFRSCLTLFSQLPGGDFFRVALERLGEEADAMTLELLRRSSTAADKT
jgi:uncharacterized protein (DUF1810 family)